MVKSKTYDLIVNERNRMPDDQINIILPPEMLEKILKLLNFKDTCQANLVCRRWNEIIVNGNLVKKASSKTSTNLPLFDL